MSMAKNSLRTTCLTMPSYPVVDQPRNLLKPRQNQLRCSGVGRSSRAHRAGLMVRALMEEKTVATAMVRANCL